MTDTVSNPLTRRTYPKVLVIKLALILSASPLLAYALLFIVPILGYFYYIVCFGAARFIERILSLSIGTLTDTGFMGGGGGNPVLGVFAMAIFWSLISVIIGFALMRIKIDTVSLKTSDKVLAVFFILFLQACANIGLLYIAYSVWGAN